jgi:hypothetical protein
MIPITAIEIFFRVPSLYLELETEAPAQIYRLCCGGQWKPKSEGYGHAFMYQSMMEEPN